MRIDSIELHRLRVPLTSPYKLSFGPVTHFDTLIAEIRDQDGRLGVGEATPLTGYTDETVEGAWAYLTRVAPTLRARETHEVEGMLSEGFDSDPFAATTLNTAVEMLLDSPLITVATRERVPMLGLLNAMSETEISTEIEYLLGQGYTTLKVKVGFDAQADARRVRFIQQVLAKRALIRLDANQGYDRAAACTFVKALQPDGIELLEQPCAAADWDSAVAVARVSAVPMMLDESIYDRDDIRRAAELKAARFIKLKLMKFGGLARLERGLKLIRELEMEPVLGNGVACEIGCWMEACVARTTIRNAGEMNGFLKPIRPLTVAPLKVDRGAMMLEPGVLPQLDHATLATLRVAHARFG